MTDARRGFRRSSRFGIIGVLVVAAASAAIALLFGADSANPTGALIAILALVFGFVGVLMYLQRRDLETVAAGSKIDPATPAVTVTDPTTVDRVSLLADLATGPIDREALGAAESRVWEIARRSVSAGPPMMVLIFCAVVPWVLFQWIWSIVVFVPLIVIYAIYLGARALMPGGSLDQAYDASAPTLTALGLAEVERPRVAIRRRAAGPRHEVEGASAYSGERHGRPVTVRIDGGSEVRVGGPVRPFEVRAEGERLRATPAAPGEVEAVLAPLRASSYWQGVTVRGGAEGVVVERERGGEHWLCDLWLAERLAAATASG